ncbi:carbohydrate sulfotransferase 11-like [Mercenaria mercenaria]|uniref:carbohydrate sulfotransferase 11-like n=1 Tax=Mercenaria mercenaria TaxID=6596 RepID=UPI00234F4646|nr:carbohydrate sulfotransferase 11-like [Mercenaria mercenaria]
MAHNSKFNVSYIAIPKIGSTFLKQMFFVLKYGPTYANQSFSTPRNIVHINFIGQRKRLYFYSSLEETVTVVAVRNPFSRLFSAYIDKVYLPNCIRLLTDILAYKHRHNTIHAENYTPSDQNDKQGLTITFLDFLNYALDPFQKKKIFWDHYEPCFPQLKKLICNSKRYIVVKQETFEADITYVLQSLGVNRTEHETYNIITRSLYESRVEDSIPGIIKETFAHAKENAKLWTGHIVAERLWHSFQIQGLIDQQIPFPETYFNFKLAYSNVSFILDVFLKVMQGGKLSRAASLEQRKEAMLSAYKALPKHVIQNVNDMYDCDFKAFGYNTTLFSDEIHLKRSENVAKLAAYKI